MQMKFVAGFLYGRSLLIVYCSIICSILCSICIYLERNIC